jgi:nitrite reductase/ring-hydroxylating ferredoxin subunit
MPQFVPATKAADIPAGQGKTVTCGSALVALFNVDGQFHAISNTCPHRGGPLGEGSVSGGVVTCPFHGFQFDVKTGLSAEGKPLRVASYPTRVVNGIVEVEI